MKHDRLAEDVFLLTSWRMMNGKYYEWQLGYNPIIEWTGDTCATLPNDLQLNRE